MPTRTKSKRRIDPAVALVTGNPQIEPSKWYAIQHDIEVTECCDCGMVHETEWKLERGRIWWRTKVNYQATAAARKKSGVKIVKPVTE
jgi:hypothetical protein